jgi:hypothetical protein
MVGHEYTVEFRIFSKTLDPSEITRELALQPCQIRVEGALGPGGRVQDGMWAFDGAEGSINWESLEDGLNFVLDKLWPLRETIAKYKSNGKLIWWCGNFQSSGDLENLVPNSSSIITSQTAKRKSSRRGERVAGRGAGAVAQP